MKCKYAYEKIKILIFTQEQNILPYIFFYIEHKKNCVLMNCFKESDNKNAFSILYDVNVINNKFKIIKTIIPAILADLDASS